MEDLDVNSLDLQFLLGITRREADVIIHEVIGYGKDKNGKEKKVTSSTTVKVSSIKLRLRSAHVTFDGLNPVQNAISLIREYGLPYALKKAILEDKNCLKWEKAKGKYRPLNKILTQKQLSELQVLLAKRRELFISCGGSFDVKSRSK